MTFRVILYILTDKTPIILICMIGIVAVSYGMFKHKKKNEGIHPEQPIILSLKPYFYDIFLSIVG